MNDSLLTISGAQIADLIRRGKTTSREAVEVHIEKIMKVNPVINAVVKDRFEEARKEADAADRKRKSSAGKNLPPYHGVPCTIKEAYALKGMPHTSGLVSRKNIVAQEDATAVARLRKARAIPLGVTNVPELCMWFETYNKIYGRSNNPYNRRRIVGGSSGGEGAIVGAGGSPFGLGSDIGGSIRMPAFFNGVFGHKPTGGLVPGTGHYPVAENGAARYCTFGVLTRRAEDLMPLTQILAGPDGKDDSCLKFKLKKPSDFRIKGSRVICVDTNGFISPSRTMRAAQRKCADAFEKLGAEIREVSIKKLKASFLIWSDMLAKGSPTPFYMILGGGKPLNASLEFLKWMLRISDHTYPVIQLAFMEKLNKGFPGMVKKYVAMGQALRQELVSLIGDNGIMLYPSYPTTAPWHNKPLLTPFNFAYTAILNVMEFPATQVPLGLDSGGLPLGVQVTALHGNDHMTIAAAMELEKEFGGWVPPWR
ncbi:MAG TPA: amidase [Spirochaetota bacterium]|nr:amidase [Spirochaetota bacterium]HOD16334.1 amidase [Spirochaetota bacterium]HPG50711.1 amidase [Spirochaetota bacterium]HPN12135.1 amidase [Spirochaetota bacterium]HQL81439.1 amidase [Spirochaetota bacterium]